MYKLQPSETPEQIAAEFAAWRADRSLPDMTAPELAAEIMAAFDGEVTLFIDDDFKPTWDDVCYILNLIVREDIAARKAA